MKDRVPGRPKRIRLTYDDGTVTEAVMARADEPIEPGTPLNKATLLPDYVCDVLHLDRVTSTPGEALLAVPGVVGKGLLRVQALHWDGTPYTNLRITGIPGIAAERCYTDGAGRLVLYVGEGSFAVGSADNGKYFDTSMPSVAVKVSAFGITEAVIREIRLDSNGILELTASRNAQFSPRVKTVDAVLVGSGGKGGNGGTGGQRGGGGAGGSGGEPGQILEMKAIAIVPDTVYPIVIGAKGGNTTAFGRIAAAGMEGRDGRAGGDDKDGGKGGTFTNAPGSFGGRGGQGGKCGKHLSDSGEQQGMDGEDGAAGMNGNTQSVPFFDGLMRLLRKGGPGGGGGGGAGGANGVAGTEGFVLGGDGSDGKLNAGGAGGDRAVYEEWFSEQGGQYLYWYSGNGGKGGGEQGTFGGGGGAGGSCTARDAGATGGTGYGDTENPFSLEEYPFGSGGPGGGGNGANGKFVLNTTAGKGAYGKQGVVYIRLHYV